MKLWHFDIGLNQPETVEAENFESAFAQLQAMPEFHDSWSLLKFEEKPVEPDPTMDELEKKSEELWKQVSFAELKQAEQILKKNFEAMKAAVQFDAHHHEIVRRNPHAHANDVCQLKHAEKCIDEFHMWFEY